MSLARLFAVLLLLGGVTPTGDPARLFGGKAESEGHLFVLYVPENSSAPAVVVEFSPQKNAAVRQVALERAGGDVTNYGLAVSPQGDFVVLTDRGKYVTRFDGKTGRQTQVDALPVFCTGIWNFGSLILLAPGQFRGDDPMLVLQEGGQFRPATTLKARSGSSLAETMVLNFFQCGFPLDGRLPCWWSNGEPEVYLIQGSERVIRMAAVSLVDPRLQSAPRGSGTDLDKRFSRMPFPIRDAFLVSADAFWLLTNQEGDRLASDRTAPHGRHILLVQAGKVLKSVRLERTGRAILAAGPGKLLLLYSDETVDWVFPP